MTDHPSAPASRQDAPPIDVAGIRAWSQQWPSVSEPWCVQATHYIAALLSAYEAREKEIETAMGMLSGGRLFGPDGVEAPTTLVDRIGHVLDDAASSDDIASMLRAERDALKAENERLTTCAQRAAGELRHAFATRYKGELDAGLVSRAITILENATTPGATR